MVVFRQIHHLPDPMPRGEHYDDFDSVYGTETTEAHRPPLSFEKLYIRSMTCPSTHLHREPRMPISFCSVTVVLNGVLFTQNPNWSQDIESLCALVDLCCKILMVNDVYVRRNLTCKDTTEVTYHGAGNENICIHCGTLDDLIWWSDLSDLPMAVKPIRKAWFTLVWIVWILKIKPPLCRMVPARACYHNW